MIFVISYFEVLWIQANRSQICNRCPNKITNNLCHFHTKEECEKRN